MRDAAAGASSVEPSSTLTCVSESGWHSGMRSLVRLAAMMPAMRAAASTSPFGALPLTISAIGLGAHLDERAGDRAAVRDGLVGDVDHVRVAVLVEVRESRRTSLAPDL